MPSKNYSEKNVDKRPSLIVNLRGLKNQVSRTTAALSRVLEQANLAIQNGDYNAAIATLKPLAESGNTRAEATMGSMFFNGFGVDQNYGSASIWYFQAAVKGNADAQYHLGLMNLNGLGMPKSGSLAMKWLRRASDQGYVAAKIELAKMYESGNCIQRDIALAIRFYRDAAEHGDASAQHTLGQIYNGDRLGQSDPKEAIKWHRMAAYNGHLQSQLELALLYEHGTGVPVDLVRACVLYGLAADQGSTDAKSRHSKILEKMTQHHRELAAQIGEVYRVVKSPETGDVP